MEELLKQLLEGQNQLFEGQNQLFGGQKQLFNEVSGIKVDITGIKEDIAKLDNKIDVLAAHQEENVMGLLSLTNSKIDSLTTASKNSIGEVMKRLDQIDKKQTIQGESINLLALHQFQNETEIALLKKAE